MVIGEPHIKSYPLRDPNRLGSVILFQDYFRLRAILGQGQFGIVLLVNCLYNLPPVDQLTRMNHDPETEEQSAIKVITKAKLHKGELEILRSEAQILQ